MLHQATLNIESTSKVLEKRNLNSSSNFKSNPRLNLILNLGLSCVVELLLAPRIAWKHLWKKKKHLGLSLGPISNPNLNLGLSYTAQLLLAPRSITWRHLQKIKKINPCSSFGPISNSNLNSSLSCTIELLLVPRLVRRHLQKKQKNPNSSSSPILNPSLSSGLSCVANIFLMPKVAQRHLQKRKEKKRKNHKRNSGSILGLELELGLVTCHQVISALTIIQIGPSLSSSFSWVVELFLTLKIVWSPSNKK